MRQETYLDVRARDELWEHAARVLEQLGAQGVRTDRCSIECIDIDIVTYMSDIP